MARKAAAAIIGNVTLNLSGLNVITCDSVELDGSFVNVTNDPKGESYRLPARTTVFGQDGDGGWYASLATPREETLEVDSVESSAEGMLARQGDAAFVYVPALHLDRVRVEGDIEITEAEEDAGEDEPAADEPEEAPAPRARRGRGR